MVFFLFRKIGTVNSVTPAFGKRYFCTTFSTIIITHVYGLCLCAVCFYRLIFFFFCLVPFKFISLYILTDFIFVVVVVAVFDVFYIIIFRIV